MIESIASLTRGLAMVVLPIAAFGVGVIGVDWHDDSLRKAVISKNWSSTTPAALSKTPTKEEGGKPKDTQGKKPKGDKKADGG